LKRRTTTTLKDWLISFEARDLINKNIIDYIKFLKYILSKLLFEDN
jgi:hypothetical protein